MKRRMQTALVALTATALLVAASIPAGAADGDTNLNASESAAAVSKVAPKANVAKPTSGRDRYDAKTKNTTVRVPKSVTGDVVLTAYALSAMALGKSLEVRYYTGPGSLYFLYWGC